MALGNPSYYRKCPQGGNQTNARCTQTLRLFRNTSPPPRFCAKPLTRANNVAIRAERLKNLNNSVFTIDRTEDTCRPPRFREWKTPRRRSNSVPFRFGFNIDIYKLGIYYNYRVILSSREPIYSEQSYTGMTDDDENLESSYSRRRLKPALGVRIR